MNWVWKLQGGYRSGRGRLGMEGPDRDPDRALDRRRDAEEQKQGPDGLEREKTAGWT